MASEFSAVAEALHIQRVPRAIDYRSGFPKRTIRKAVGQEAKDILELYRLTYGRQKTADEFSWLYLRNPSGLAQTWLARDEENAITVSARPVFPWRIKILGKEIVACQSGDAMTHPGYRRQGIFTALVRVAWSHLRAQGIPLIYSFPNEHSRSIHRRAKVGSGVHTGCHQIGSFRRMVKPLRIQDLLTPTLGRNPIAKYVGRSCDILMGRLTERPARDRSLVIKELRQFDERFDILWERASESYKVIGVRDSRFLNWRYFNVPNKRHIVLSAEAEGEALGFAVFEMRQSVKGLNEAHLIEIFSVPHSVVATTLLAEVISYCRAKNVSRLVSCALDGSDWANTLRRAGFIPRSDRFPFFVHILVETPYTHTLLDPKNWFITLGDRDI